MVGLLPLCATTVVEPWQRERIPRVLSFFQERLRQMPQLLRQFGFEHAVVWRGVPAAVERSAFWWTAPDGSSVRAEYLPQGYGNGASVPDDAKRLVLRIAEFADGYRDRGDAVKLREAGREASPGHDHCPHGRRHQQ